jgi:hypothetical protein
MDRLAGVVLSRPGDRAMMTGPSAALLLSFPILEYVTAAAEEAHAIGGVGTE